MKASSTMATNPASVGESRPQTSGDALLALEPHGRGVRVRVGAYIELTKPGITRLVAMTSAAGFYMGSHGGIQWIRLLHTLIGVLLAAAGANALNEYAEADLDGRMRRTRLRPLPSRRIGRRGALLFALAMSLVGAGYLLIAVNAATALLVSASILCYILVYTPLKRLTTLATLVGAIPGALPVLAGWTASGAPLDPAAWSLFWILFLWQIPHFLALAWMHREDYRRGGYAMLSVFDPDGRATSRQAMLYAIALLPVSLLPNVLGLAGAIYFFGAFALGLAFVALAVAMVLDRSTDRARRLFLASVIYLPLLLVLLVVNKV